MIDNEFPRLDAIKEFLEIIDGQYVGVRWCTRCDFPWRCCSCAWLWTFEYVNLSTQEAVEAFGRLFGG